MDLAGSACTGMCWCGFVTAPLTETVTSDRGPLLEALQDIKKCPRGAVMADDSEWRWEDNGGGGRARRPHFSISVCIYNMEIVNRNCSQLHVDFHISAIFHDSRLRGKNSGTHLQQEKN